MRSRICIFLSLLTLLCPAAVLSQSRGVLGDWKEPGGSVIRIDHCGHEVCLWLVEISRTAPSQEDIHNPDPALRTRALCGLEIGKGFTLRDGDHASGGTLYDPKSGKTYRGQMSAADSKLELRGYVGIPLFGRSEIWTRTGEISSCAAPHS